MAEGRGARAEAVPSIAEAAGVLGLVLALSFASALIGGAAAELAVFQIVAVGLPVAVMAWVNPAPARALLALRRPRLTAVAGAALAGAGVLIFNLAVVVPLSLLMFSPDRVPGPELGAMPVWAELLVLAALPAVCEELLFRAVVFRALAQRSLAAAFVVSPLLFALFHFSKTRLLPTAAVGLVASVAVWRTKSSWAAVSCHFANNAAVIGVAAVPGIGAVLPAWGWAGIGGLGIAGGIALLPGSGR